MRPVFGILLALTILGCVVQAQDAHAKPDTLTDNENPSHIATDAGHVDHTDPIPPTGSQTTSESAEAEVVATDDGVTMDPAKEAEVEEQAALIKKKLKEFQMMQHFFCFMGVRKYVQSKKQSLESFVKEGGNKAGQKLIATLFAACQEDTMQEEVMDKLFSVKNREEADQIEFPFYTAFDLPAFVDKKDFEMTDEDKKNLKLFDDVQKKFEKMAKDAKKERKAEEEEDEPERPTPKKRKASADMSPWVKYPIFLAVIGFVMFLAKLALKSTSEPPQRTRKKEEKDRKKKQ